MEGRLADLRRRVERDFGEPRLRFAGLTFLPAAQWSEVHPAATAAHDGGSGYLETDLVCVSGGHSFLVDGSPDAEALLVAIVSVLQDDAMDTLASPWPSIEVDGVFQGVLEPRLSPDSVAVWATRTGFSCPIGLLQTTFGAAHLIA